MALTVKVITLWRREIENRPGALAGVLQPLATTKADLQVLMAYRFPGDASRGAVELFPIAGKKGIAAASDAGLTPANDIPAVLVQGPNGTGIGYQTSRKIARPVARAAENAAGAHFTSDCPMAAEQIASVAEGVTATHPLQLLRRAYGI